MKQQAIYGDRLRQARILRHQTGQETAARLGVAPPTVTRWEQRETFAADEAELRRIAAALEFPARFFLTAPVAPVADNHLLFRAPKSTPKKETTYLREFARLVADLLGWVESKRVLPPLLAPNLPSDVDIVAAASAARRALGYEQLCPIRSLTHAIERAGVPVVRRPESARDDAINEKHLGYTTWVGDFWERPIIVTRGVSSWERTRWTIAHEIGHATIHRSEGVVSTYGDDAEDAANRFANELLAPIEAVERALPSIVTLFSLIDMKREWGISLGALIMHLHNNHLIGKQRFETLRAQLYSRVNPNTGTTYGRYEPGWDEREPEKPSMLRHWLERTVGSSEPAQVSAISDMWPTDLLGEILSEQRRTSVVPRTRQRGPGDVVDLNARRIRARR